MATWCYGRMKPTRHKLSAVRVTHSDGSVVRVQLGRADGARACIASDWHLNPSRYGPAIARQNVRLALDKLPGVAVELRKLNRHLEELVDARYQGEWRLRRKPFVRVPYEEALDCARVSIAIEGDQRTRVWVLEYGSNDAMPGTYRDLIPGHECVVVATLPTVWVAREQVSLPIRAEQVMVFRPRPRVQPGQFNMGRSRIHVHV